VQKFYSIYRYHQDHKTSTGGSDRRQEILQIVQQYSSDYWQDLYLKVEQNYDKIKRLEAWVSSLKVPKKRYLFSYLLPREVKHHCRDIQHLYTVLGMYG